MRDLTTARQRVKGPLHEALHTLEPHIPNVPGECHCNLIAEVALDALAPVLVEIAAAEARGYDRAIANLRTGAVHERVENSSTALWAVYLAAADYLEAQRDQP